MKAAGHAAHEAVAVDQPDNLATFDDGHIEKIGIGVEEVEDFLVDDLGIHKRGVATQVACGPDGVGDISERIFRWNQGLIVRHCSTSTPQTKVRQHGYKKRPTRKRQLAKILTA
jgi:hypothetical protein